jgi:hypothetical protein
VFVIGPGEEGVLYEHRDEWGDLADSKQIMDEVIAMSGGEEEEEQDEEEPNYIDWSDGVETPLLSSSVSPEPGTYENIKVERQLQATCELLQKLTADAHPELPHRSSLKGDY